MDNQGTAPQSESSSRPQAAVTGVIDLTINEQAASPCLSASSDCIVVGASRFTQAPRSAGHIPNSELTEPSYAMDEPPRHSVSSHAVSSAAAGVVQPMHPSSAAVQLPMGDSRFTGASLSARPEGSGQGPPTAPAAQLLATPADAQAASTKKRRRRWDVMPEQHSPDTLTARNPVGSEAIVNMPVQSSGFRAASHPVRAEAAEMSGLRPLPAEVDRQQQDTGRPQDASANGRPEANEAATQLQQQYGYRSRHQARQSKKRLRAGNHHSRHRRHRRHSRRHQKHSRGRHYRCPDAGLAGDRQCVASSSSTHFKSHEGQMLLTPEAGGGHLESGDEMCLQQQSGLESTKGPHADQDDRWQMWHPQDV